MAEKEIKELSDKIDRLMEALIGNKLDRKVGYLDQIDSNTENININKNDIYNHKKKVEKLENKSRSYWSKIGIASGAGVGIGGIGATKSGYLLNKLIEFFS